MQTAARVRTALENLTLLLLFVTPGCMPYLRTITQTWITPVKELIDLIYFLAGALLVGVGITGIQDIANEILTTRPDKKSALNKEFFYLFSAVVFVFNGLSGALAPLIAVPPSAGLAFALTSLILTLYELATCRGQ